MPHFELQDLYLDYDIFTECLTLLNTVEQFCKINCIHNRSAFICMQL